MSASAVSAILLDPITLNLVITGLRAGREALQIIKMADMEELPPGVKEQLLAKRDELDAKFDELMPK